MSDTIPISEVFGPTIEGEGPVIGRPTVFVRTGGCDYRCSWCDSLHAVLPAHRKEWTPCTPHAVFAMVRALAPKPIMVTLSGGNPCMHKGLEEVIRMGHEHGDTFAVETQGTIATRWLKDCDWVVLSPKPPSSGMKYDHDKLLRCLIVARGIHPYVHVAGQVIALKVPVFNSDDLFFAEHVGKQFPDLPLYLSVGNATPPKDEAATEEFNTWQRGEAGLLDLLNRYDWLCQMVIQRKMQAIVLPQMHVLVWGNRRGV